MMSSKNNAERIVITKRTCDEPMARSMKLLPCTNSCEQCMACIEWLSNGEKRHFSPKKSY